MPIRLENLESVTLDPRLKRILLAVAEGKLRVEEAKCQLDAVETKDALQRSQQRETAKTLLEMLTLPSNGSMRKRAEQIILGDDHGLCK